MKRERSKGITYSAALHIVGFLLAIFGLPVLLHDDMPEEPTAMSVEILPTAAVSNVRNSAETPEKVDDTPKQPPKQPEPPTPPKPPEPEKKPLPPAKTQDSAPEPVPTPKPVEKPDVKKPEVKKPDEKPKEKKKPKEEDPLDAVLKSLKSGAETSTPPESTEEKKDPASSSKTKSKSDRPFDPNSPEALSTRDAIANQIYKCWSVPAGVMGAHEMIVIVSVKYNQDGTFRTVELTPESRAKANAPAYRASADAAMRAVRMCSPLKDMKPDQYHIWQDVQIRFDPKDLLY